MNNFRALPPPIKPIESLHFEHVHPIVLPNGIQCYRMPPRDLGVVKLDVFWPYGTRNQNRKYEARTSLALSLSGTDKLTAEQINEEFEYQGSSIGYETQMLQSVFHIKSSKEHFLSSFRHFLDNFSEAIFPEAEIINFSQIEQAGLLRKMQTPRYWAHRLCFESLFDHGSPMASFADVEDIANLDKQAVIAYHQAYLHLQNAVFIISGETGDALFQDFLTILSNIPVNPVAVSDHQAFVESTQNRGLFVKRNVEHTQQVSLYMGSRFEKVSEDDIHGFTLMNMLLGGFFGSRLMQEIREEKGLTYGIGSYITQSNDGNVWCISGEMNSKNVEQARDAIIDIMGKLVTEPPAGTELEKAKLYYCGQLRSSFDGPFSLSSKIRNMMVRGYSYAHYDHALDHIWKISTDDLCRIADNYLKPDTFNTVLAGDIN